jgi:hypothetical protein
MIKGSEKTRQDQTNSVKVEQITADNSLDMRKLFQTIISKNLKPTLLRYRRKA